MLYKNEELKKELISQTGSTSNYLSDLRTAYSGGNYGSDLKVKIKTLATGGVASNYDSDVWEQFEREKSVTSKKVLSEGITVLCNTTDFE